ncbi:hypothetical protein SH1V18_12790 [Vallitalea longa]|uniref:Uncharacterized protein n=1 Tax=Vallitalea longa TaxID=2936439 RepID=A0A9W5Y932_9FIRM|nr:hypothetical protein SH1V18_12790 [Vallitalea longa]
MSQYKGKMNIKIILILLCLCVSAKHIISLPYFESMDYIKFIIGLSYSALFYTLLLFLINLIIVSIRRFKSYVNKS